MPTQAAASVHPAHFAQSSQNPPSSPWLHTNGNGASGAGNYGPIANPLLSVPGMVPGPQRGSVPPPNLQHPNKKPTLGTRARNRYNRLSTPQKVLCLILLVAILLPSLAVVFELINGVILYTQIEGGMSHLRAAADVFKGGPSDGGSKYFDMAKLQQAQGDMNDAHSSFAALSDELDTDGSLALAGSLLPAQLTTLRKLGHVAVDATVIGQDAITSAIKVAPTLGPALKNSKNTSQPYLDPASYNELSNLLVQIRPLVHDMNMRTQGISLTGLPLSTSQRDTVSSVLPLLPVVDTVLSQAPSYKDAIGWFLGVGQPRSFLIEPMDNSELRATGGFTGQFGQLTFTGGHMAPLTLQNIGAYEEDHSGDPGGVPPIDPTLYKRVVGQPAPGLYADWWPVANFGVRDANVSADFPTSAKIIIDRYNYEFQKNIDGVIIFTPALIQQVLQVTGPIKIERYNETITAQNLEDRLHYYQLNNTGIRKEEIIEHQDNPELARKLFTQRVTKQLTATVEHLPMSKLLPMVGQMLQSMKTKDLQIYFDNPQLEGLIAKYGSTVSMDRSHSHDGLYVVQENLSASKASQYVTTSIKDTVMLDAQGDATHKMVMTLNYQQKGDVYGFDTYHDYVRVYVPQNSTFVSGDGFSLPGQTYCTDNTPCQSDVYGDGTLLCTPPVVVGGSTGYTNISPGDQLYQTGAPPNQTSDEPGRAMYGGWVMIPKNCVMKVSLSWTVPAESHQGYSMLFQAQAGIATDFDLTIQSPNCSSRNLRYASTLHGQDTTFSVQHTGTGCSLQRKIA